jgi:hypothetical protein
VTLPAALREYAETPDRFARVPAGGSVERFADERVCILQAATWASVSGVSVDGAEVESLLAEVRARVPAEKDSIWWIGPSARPPDLHERLQALGLGEPRDSLVHALVLVHEPAGAQGVSVCRVETYERFRAAREVQWEAFDMPEDRRAKNQARLREDFEESQRFEVPIGFLALLDGRPAATAFAVPSDRGVFLFGGATAEWARGHGLYRALVRVRWDYAVARGTPALATHAMPDTSYPILRRLGFEEVCTLRRLEDS